MESKRGGSTRGAPRSGPKRTISAARSASIESLLAQLGPLIDPQVALLLVLDHEPEPPAVLYAWGLTGGAKKVAALRRSGYLARAGSRQRPALDRLDAERDAGLIRSARVPLTHAATAAIRGPDGKAHSQLIAGFTRPPEDRAVSLWALRSAASLMAVSLLVPGVLERFAVAPTIDALTGCVTYAHTLYELGREINRSARLGAPLSCCFVDLDGFKQVNDEHGHLRGNEVLAEIGRVLRAGVRSFDTVGRYGGDEFVVILPQTGETEARAIAERMLSLIGQTSFPSLELRLTASIGVAEWKPGSAPEDLLAAADRALLQAKSSGGRVLTATQLRAHA